MSKLNGAERAWNYTSTAHAFPGWLCDVLTADKPDPNGAVLIVSRVGHMRLHVGYVAFQAAGFVYAYHPSEAQARLDEILLEGRSWANLPRERETLDAEAGQADRTDDTDDVSLRAVGITPPPPPKPRYKDEGRYAPTKGMPPSIENRHPSELRIDDSYQRSIDTGPSQSLIERIARGWDWRMCLPLVVSKRDDGSLYVIDGQHRLAAAQRRGDIPFLPCCVGVYGSVADEAAMFVAMNRARRQMNRLDDFHAAQAGNDPDATAIAALVTGVGFTVSRKTGSASWVPGEVAFTSAIQAVRRKHGDPIPREALQIMADAFPDERLTAGASVFTALCRVLVTPPAGFDRDRLFRAVLKFDMKGWASFLQGAKGGDDRAHKLREILLMAYDETAPQAVAA
jgi:hypothetical protein